MVKIADKKYEKLLEDPTREIDKYKEALEEFRKIGKKQKKGIEALLI